MGCAEAKMPYCSIHSPRAEAIRMGCAEAKAELSPIFLTTAEAIRMGCAEAKANIVAGMYAKTRGNPYGVC